MDSAAAGEKTVGPPQHLAAVAAEWLGRRAADARGSQSLVAVGRCRRVGPAAPLAGLPAHERQSSRRLPQGADDTQASSGKGGGEQGQRLKAVNIATRQS